VNIGKALGRVGIVLSVAVTVAIGQTPASVKIGNQTWTKQNLNVKTQDSWCYEDKESNCAEYGRLYTWEAAKKACQSMGGKWRLPTNDDWDNLLRAVGGVRKVDEDGDVVFKIVGKKLKSKTGWNTYEGKSGNGTDEFGFSALPGGYRYYGGGSFNYVGIDGFWWSATEYGSGDAYYRDMYYNYDGVFEGSDLKSSGYSVRCVAQD
jgi:uncharacterized protein (TIGR02145 family)